MFFTPSWKFLTLSAKTPKSISKNFKRMRAYLSQSIEQAQTRFAKVLAENRRLKGFLLEMVKNCSCQEGSRCPQCQRILGTLNHFGI